MPDLNHRARKILSAITQEYLSTGEAVGSRRVTRRYGVDLSPATVRNVMSDLEELGLIRQPHTSAGRVPTELGLRFFVDSLLKVRQLSSKEKEELEGRYAFSGGEVDTVLREAGKVLSDLSSHTVVVVAPSVDADVLSHVEFIRLPDPLNLLAVLVAQGGRVMNKIVHLEAPISPEELDRINNYLNDRLDGRSLAEVRKLVSEELQSERTRYDALAQRALLISQKALPAEDTAVQPDVFVEGHANLLAHLLSDEQPVDGERLKALFRTLEDRRLLLRLLEKTESASGIRVFIGAESKIPELSDYTVVTTPYGDQAVGVLGVIGPTRMNYSRVIALVDFTAQLLSSVVGKR